MNAELKNKIELARREEKYWDDTAMIEDFVKQGYKREDVELEINLKSNSNIKKLKDILFINKNIFSPFIISVLFLDLIVLFFLSEYGLLLFLFILVVIWKNKKRVNIYISIITLICSLFLCLYFIYCFSLLLFLPADSYGSAFLLGSLIMAFSFDSILSIFAFFMYIIMPVLMLILNMAVFFKLKAQNKNN